MPVTIRGEFQRSVSLARDFYGDRDVSGYVVTARAREVLGRITDALSKPGSQRAWTLTGPYGGGKSAFALFTAHLLRGSAGVADHLAEVDPALADRIKCGVPGAFCPVLVVGSREPLRRALLNGLAAALKPFAQGLHGKRGRPTKAIQARKAALLALAEEATKVALEGGGDSVVLDLFERARAAVQEATGGGFLLVVDELGKFLEYAALHPSEGDLFLLQSLAEHASRSGAAEGGAGAAPFLVLTILHQAFDRYGAQLSRAQRDEWRKVQGRYEDVAFIEPVGETLRLLARAIERDGEALDEGASASVDALLGVAHLAAPLDREQVREHLLDSLPLHPAVALLVGPLFRRLAQNERSLFAFLSSGEPHGFTDVVGGEGSSTSTEGPSGDAGLQVYRLDHLYDYLITALGGTLFHDHVGRLWAETEAALSRLAAADVADPDLSERLLKQIALLSYAGPLAGIPPTIGVLRVTAGADPAVVDAALDGLVEARVVVFRRAKEEYRIWEGSDFDLDAALQEAREHVSLRTPLAELLRRAVPPLPVVARRHSYRTGTTRVFEVHYVSEDAWAALLKKPFGRADGRILYVLPERDGEVEPMVERLREATAEAGERGRLTLVAVPRGTVTLREAVRELACFDWVRENSDALQGDAAARREVEEQRADLAAFVQHRLGELLRHADADGRSCIWVYQGGLIEVPNERALQETLSGLCDGVYGKAPEVWNELLNRRKPSSSAVRGLKLLLRAMLEHPAEPRLGIEGTPAEYGMYVSILEKTGLHRVKEGRWGFHRPDPNEHPGCAAVWDAVVGALREANGAAVPVSALYDLLRRPPYGVREGLLPVFLFAVYVHFADDVGLYEEGTFVQRLDFEAVERLLRHPDRFAFQLVDLNERRAAVLRGLAPLVGLPTRGSDEALPKPLPVVIRILGRASTLPPYVRRTALLTDGAIAVREALFAAKDPASLLFRDLPVACGVGSFMEGEEVAGDDVQTFAGRLMAALRELTGAYDDLLDWIEGELARAFHLQERASDERRHELAERARVVQRVAVEQRLKSFVVRASDEVLDTRGWYESVAALLAHCPPAQWTDEDRVTFERELKEVARLFHHREAVGFEGYQGSAEESGAARRVERVRLSVTATFEEEREAVVAVHREDQEKVDAVLRRLVAALDDGPETLETKLAALGQLSLRILGERDDAPDPIKQALSEGR